MRMKILFLASCLLAALVPFAPTHARTDRVSRSAANWPAFYEGRPLAAAALTEREDQFLKGFPGQMAKFSDGEREILIRQVNSPTRMLHPGVHCYKGFGFNIAPRPLWPDKNGKLWGCFLAEKKGHTGFLIREQITDLSGQSWTDVSAWYWSAVLGRTKGPWQAVTIAEPYKAGQNIWLFRVSRGSHAEDSPQRPQNWLFVGYPPKADGGLAV